MSIWYNHVRAGIRLHALVDNFRLIRARAANPAPIIKSDAYGHGLPQVARALFEAGARTLAAGTVGEAAVLKDTVPEAEVISLLGPLDAADYECVCERDIVAFVGSTEQLLLLEEAAGRVGTTVRVALKFDTGMARLGFDAVEAAGVADTLDGLEHVRATMVCSHLATADDPEQAGYAREQGEKFERIVGTLHARGLDVRASLANSGAIFGHPGLHHDLQRPGIALYGGNPFFGTAWEEKGRGLRQAMQVSSRLVQVRTIAAGQSVSYGRTFTAPAGMRVGIVAVGYADNYSRGLSAKAQMLLHGRRVPVLGRVCMQLTAVDLTGVPEAAVGDEVFLLGGAGPQSISADELAAWWGTITYEVFCLLGQNPRTYVD
ncbi:MAG: alanine racemase [Desulfomicrobium sp.]|nr:alanine racemase [Pseudomonadota bacterium]MBV1711856.1 alanine racemase [Desulfomicrobium sp.]MBU4571033.1 alanine racemase [Pseudomonadota bacterium]MBU4593662.1 alanine racemase [Pseudomonadota bacterium]MBV1719082.1 alanine racemase [Desulfomicrobium sp.]